MKLPRNVWTPVARRPVGGALGSWVEYQASPVTIEQALDGAYAGKLILMHRRVDDLWQIVVAPMGRA